MAIIIKKFGGTSVGSIERIRAIAQRIALSHREGDRIVIVVSAMAKTTDELFALAFQVSDHPSRRELDMLLTAGERITMSLLSLALQEEGFSSISFTGSQSGIITDGKHGNARILRINAFRINEELEKGKIVIVAGFQGVSTDKEITTLGRGGSDTSAVALASYLNADLCEIYTDVEGVYSADPRIVKNPRFIPEIDYGQMLALAYNGSKVLHPRAVEFAYQYQVPLVIRSSFSEAEGTLLTNRIKDNNMEDRKITAIAHKDGIICLTLKHTSLASEVLSDWSFEIFKYRFNNGLQTRANGGKDGSLNIYVEEKYLSEVLYFLSSRNVEVLNRRQGLGFVVLTGIGINLDLGFLAKTLELTQELDIIEINHSEHTIELLLPQTSVHTCVNILHDAFISVPKNPISQDKEIQ